MTKISGRQPLEDRDQVLQGQTRWDKPMTMMQCTVPSMVLMTHKYRGCIVVLSINKSVEPNEEQKVLTSGFEQGFTVNTSKRVFRGIW
jgi:hypothetical protein